jgi:hypothetical protein
MRSALVLVFDVRVEPDTGASLGQHGRERRLVHLQRIAAQGVAVQRDQVAKAYRNTLPSLRR